MTIAQQILKITKYTNLVIEANRVRIGVDPRGIKPSEFVAYYELHCSDSLQNALTQCIEYLPNNNKYWEDIVLDQAT